MWLLFHRNAKTRPVRGGDSFVEICPECGKRATFVEVEVTESFGMFFVDLVGDKERAYRCGACGETFDLKDQLPAGGDAGARAKPALPQKSTAELAREREIAEERRREAARAKAVRIEDELADLKKRMGR
jgi:DNA-directed RNA polymerase subunit RPC12/RpoP